MVIERCGAVPEEVCSQKAEESIKKLDDPEAKLKEHIVKSMRFVEELTEERQKLIKDLAAQTKYVAYRVPNRDSFLIAGLLGVIVAVLLLTTLLAQYFSTAV